MIRRPNQGSNPGMNQHVEDALRDRLAIDASGVAFRAIANHLEVKNQRESLEELALKAYEKWEALPGAQYILPIGGPQAILESMSNPKKVMQELQLARRNVEQAMPDIQLDAFLIPWRQIAHNLQADSNAGRSPLMRFQMDMLGNETGDSNVRGVAKVLDSTPDRRVYRDRWNPKRALTALEYAKERLGTQGSWEIGLYSEAMVPGIESNQYIGGESVANLGAIEAIILHVQSAGQLEGDVDLNANRTLDGRRFSMVNNEVLYNDPTPAYKDFADNNTRAVVLA